MSIREIPAFGCRNSLIADDWRAMVLNFHNDKRRILSSGQQPNKDGTTLKAANKMNELVRMFLALRGVAR